MDSPYTWALGAMALVAVAFSYRVPNAILWISLMVANFLITTLYLDFSPWPNLHPGITCLFDAALAAAIFIRYREDWEIGVGIAFMTSAIVGLLRVFDFIPNSWVYPALLELCNAAALLVIMGPGVLDRVSNRDGSGTLSTVRARLHSPRRSL